MASLIYNSFVSDLARGLINMDTTVLATTGDYYAMLVTSTYVPNQDSHTKRSDITNEIVGTGYFEGGTGCTITTTEDLGNDRITISIALTLPFTNSTITARGCVYYRRRGGAANLDNLVAYNDFGGNISSTGGTFSIAASSIILQN